MVRKLADHLLRHQEVGDDAVLQGAQRAQVVRRAAQHALGLETHAGDGAVGVQRSDGGLVEHDALAPDRDDRVGGAEIHADMRHGAKALVQGATSGRRCGDSGHEILRQQ
jgi:hypothetical protein